MAKMIGLHDAPETFGAYEIEGSGEKIDICNDNDCLHNSHPTDYTIYDYQVADSWMSGLELYVELPDGRVFKRLGREGDRFYNNCSWEEVIGEVEKPASNPVEEQRGRARKLDRR